MITLKKWIELHDTECHFEAMSEEELLLLNHIIRKRRKFLFQTFLGFVLMSLMIFWHYIRIYGTGYFLYDVSRIFELTYLHFIFYYICVLIIIMRIYYKKIHTMIMDTRSGQKMVFFSKIIGKRYFPGTQQYFIFTESNPFNQFEVSGAEYHLYKPGDEFAIKFAEFSQYIFNKKGRHTIL